MYKFNVILKCNKEHFLNNYSLKKKKKLHKLCLLQLTRLYSFLRKLESFFNLYNFQSVTIYYQFTMCIKLQKTIINIYPPSPKNLSSFLQGSSDSDFLTYEYLSLIIAINSTESYYPRDCCSFIIKIINEPLMHKLK